MWRVDLDGGANDSLGDDGGGGGAVVGGGGGVVPSLGGGSDSDAMVQSGIRDKG